MTPKQISWEHSLQQKALETGYKPTSTHKRTPHKTFLSFEIKESPRKTSLRSCEPSMLRNVVEYNLLRRGLIQESADILHHCKAQTDFQSNESSSGHVVDASPSVEPIVIVPEDESMSEGQQLQDQQRTDISPYDQYSQQNNDDIVVTKAEQSSVRWKVKIVRLQ